MKKNLYHTKGRRRRNSSSYHFSNGMTVQKKASKAPKVTLIISSLVLCVAVVVIAVFVVNKFDLLHPQAGVETTKVEETTVVDTISEEEIQRQKQEYEDKIHAIEPGIQFAHFTSKPTVTLTGDTVLDRAYTLAAGYDYDKAIETIKAVTGYGTMETYVKALEEIQQAQNSTTTFQINNNITHVFFHSLIVDPTLAFDSKVAGDKVSAYNEVMTTTDEFVSMMEEMYAKGYVLVSLHQICSMQTQPDGTEKMVYNTIKLPAGKKPFVLSVDDVSYYEYMKGHGYPDKLIVKEDGSVVNTMTLTDGSEVEGNFDVLPILEEFVKLHPDFSYQGARGILALTGYNGVFGYRTCDFWYAEDCPYYEATDANNKYRDEEITYPNLNIEEDKETAKEVAQAIRDLGWELASHSWGHKRYGQMSIEGFHWDVDMWEKEVEPILGETDIILYPFGDDIGQSVGWRPYEYEGYNERYETLKDCGFRYFCNVDGNQYFMQKTDEYFRQGRRNLDGEAMWNEMEADKGVEGHKNRLTDLFDDVSTIFDPLRPTPVE